jgi:hypothetical protein
MPQNGRDVGWRRTKLTAVGVVGALGITMLTGTGSTAAPSQTTLSNNGLGSAQATGLFIDPVAGGLSFGLGIGQALAGHQNTVGSAESRAFDLGVIGVTLAAEGCDGGDPTLPAESQPQPLRAASNEEGAAEGTTVEETFAANQIVKFVRATTDPLGEAITTVGPIDIPGILRIGGIQTTARSGVVDGVRQAVAETVIGKLSLGGGAVVLNNLRWTATHTSNDEGETTEGTFTIEGVGNPTDTLAQLNLVLNVLGIELVPPTFRTADTSGGTIAIIDPLQVKVVPNALRDGILNPVLLALQPIREALFNALLEADCTLGTYITVLDVVISSLTGGGYFAVSLGGANASTSGLNLFQFPAQGTLGGPTVAPAAPAPSITTGGTPAIPAVPGTPAGPAPAPTENPVEEVAEEIADDGSRGGVMAAVAGGGLLLLLLSAEADRRKMRRAQRDFPLEA